MLSTQRNTNKQHKLFLRGPRNWSLHEQTSSSYFKYVQILKEIMFKELKNDIMIITHQIKNIIGLISKVLMFENLPNVMEIKIKKLSNLGI